MSEPKIHPVGTPRRVLMTTDPIGGVWNYSLELIRGLLAADIEVVLASMGGPVSPERRAAFAALGPGATLHESSLKLEWMENPWADVAAAGEWLLRLEREHHPDLIHLNGYAHAALAWSAPVLVVAHSCVFSWWRGVHGANPPATAWRRYHRAVSRGLARADLVVAPTRAMLTQLAAHYDSPMRATMVIPNGRDALPGADTAKENAVLGVGRLWDAAKNLGLLAALAPRLPWLVRLAGNPRSPDGAVAKLPDVELLGELSEAELGRHYGLASIYCLPARYEPFGLSVLEAAHAGCALVLGDIRSLRENWEGAALFVPPDDPSALRAALLELIERPSLRRVFGTEARHRARTLSPRRMHDAYLHAYGRLLHARAVELVST